MDARLARIEVTVGELRDDFGDAVERIEKLESTGDELRGELQGALNREVDRLAQRNEALEDLVEAMRAEINQLKGELAALRAASVVGTMGVSRADIPKPKPFAGSRSAKDVDNFVWGMEQYFRVAGIAEDAKVSTAALYLCDTALLWWRRRVAGVQRGERPVATWDEFVGELKQQFKPEYAEDEARSKLRRLTQRGTVRDYCAEFQELLLMIPSMSEGEALFSFMDGLKPWVKTELKRRGVQELSRAIAVAESLVEFERTGSPSRVDEAIGGRDPGSSSSSEGEEESSDDDEEEESSPRKSKTERAGKRKPRERKPLACFLCDGPHRAAVCPMRKELAAIAMAESQDESGNEDGQHRRVMRLGAIRSCREAGASQARTKVQPMAKNEMLVPEGPDVQPTTPTRGEGKRRRRRSGRRHRRKGQRQQVRESAKEPSCGDQSKVTRVNGKGRGPRYTSQRWVRKGQARDSPSAEDVARTGGGE